MATSEEYAAWIVKNADKKGTPEFETVAKAYRASRAPTPQKQPAIDPSEGGGRLQFATPFGTVNTGIKTPQWLERGLAGIGKAFADTGEGIAQLTDRPLDAVAGGNRVDQRRAQIAETRQLDAPLMDTTAGTVGNVLGNAALVAAVPGGSTLRGAAAVGGGLGLLQPSESNGETLTNVALGAGGGAAGRGVANLIGSTAQRAGTLLTQGQQDAAAAGQRMGMRLTPGKASGSTALQKMEAGLEANPLTTGGFDAIKRTNQRALNRAAARSIGENVDEVSSAVLSRAEDRIGRVFDSVADATPVRLDPQTVGGQLRQLVQDTEGLIGNNGRLTDNGLIQRLDDFVNTNGGASREQLRALSSKLGKAARSNMTSQAGDRELGQALFGAQSIVEDAIEGSLGNAQRASYGEARGQYRNLMNLLSGQAVNEASGNVNARSLASVLRSKDRAGYTMGRNASDLNDATRFVKAFPEVVGDSGTATRSMGPTDYLMGLPGNLLTRAYLSRPVAAAARGGVGAAGVASRLTQQPANLLGMPLSTAYGLQLPELLQQ